MAGTAWMSTYKDEVLNHFKNKSNSKSKIRLPENDGIT